MREEVHREVERRLGAIEAEEGVRVIFACESGSRAWGFASNDSDFDVRFLYVHRREWYLSVEMGRDVIERPIVDDYDVNGWELRKALRLFARSNPPLLEWLGSPIVYREVTGVATALRGLARRHHSPLACLHHYLHMARGNFRDYLRGPQVKRKKYLYVLRPLLAMRWIEAGRGVVPTEFALLLDHLPDDAELKLALDDLLAKKRAGSELDEGPRIEPISRFIEAELARHDAAGPSAPSHPPVGPAELDPVLLSALDEAWR